MFTQILIDVVDGSRFGSLETSDRMGRGARLSDLDSSILQRIYNNICRRVGRDAGAQFVQMVRDIPVLSATNFASGLIALQWHGWKWNKSLLSERGSIRSGSYGAVFGAITSAHSGHRDDTNAIRGPFLRNPSGSRLPGFLRDWLYH